MKHVCDRVRKEQRTFIWYMLKFRYWVITQAEYVKNSIDRMRIGKNIWNMILIQSLKKEITGKKMYRKDGNFEDNRK